MKVYSISRNKDFQQSKEGKRTRIAIHEMSYRQDQSKTIKSIQRNHRIKSNIPADQSPLSKAPPP